MPAISGRKAIRVTTIHSERQPPEGRVDEHAEHDDPEQERGAAARVDQRVALRDLGGQLLARLVGVDRLVLGGVVLEDALERRDAARAAPGSRRRS